MFYTSLWEDSNQDKARAERWSYGNKIIIINIKVILSEVQAKKKK
jgi:hypothetical protein